MIAFTRLLVVVLILLSLCYLLANVVLYIKRRRFLKAEWQRRAWQGDERIFLRRALRQFLRRWRLPLIGMIYIAPVTAMTVLVYIINFA